MTIPRVTETMQDLTDRKAAIEQRIADATAARDLDRAAVAAHVGAGGDPAGDWHSRSAQHAGTVEALELGISALNATIFQKTKEINLAQGKAKNRRDEFDRQRRAALHAIDGLTANMLRLNPSVTQEEYWTQRTAAESTVRGCEEAIAACDAEIEAAALS